MAVEFETHKDNLGFDLRTHTDITVAEVSLTVTSVDSKITVMMAMIGTCHAR